MTPGDCLTLTVDKPAAGGRMIARHEGAVVLVSGTLPGETVEARVERVQRGTAWAATARILEPSADRVGAEDGACGGCVFAHIRYERQVSLKREIIVDAFGRLGKMTLDPAPAVTPSPQSGYRMRARLHVRDGRAGFFREGTHQLCAAGPTGQLLPATAALIDELGARLARSAVGVREIELSENRDATGRAVHFELADRAEPSRLGVVTRLDGLTGASCSSGPARALDLWGSSTVSDTLEAGSPFALARHTRSFFQGNRYLLQELTSHVVASIEGGPIVDLYAGVGLFSVAAAAAGKGTVTAVEGDRAAVEDLKRNAAPFRDRIRVHHLPVESFVRAIKPGHGKTVIVDPPRTGLSREALAGALALGAPRLVYVSCDVATLARDARAIVDAGYAVADSRAFDLFPNTAHVETVMRFERSPRG
jgi:23S rRNA (uracil1939-C5)-methyltransferase